MELWNRLKAAGRALVAPKTPYGIVEGVLGPRYSTGKGENLAHITAYVEHPWLRQSVQKIAAGLASTEWILKAIKIEGKYVRPTDIQKSGIASRRKALSRLEEQGTAETIKEHPLLDLLNKPNRTIMRIPLVTLQAAYYEIVGENFTLLGRAGLAGRLGLPLATSLWPIPPHWVLEVPTPDSPFFRVSYRGWQAMIPERDVLWRVNPSPLNPYGRGTGIVTPLKEELMADESARRLVNYAFYNHNTPETLVSIPGMDKKMLKAYADEWRVQNQGIERTMRTHFINVEAKTEKMGSDFRSMQMADMRRFGRDTTREVLGMPPEVLGIIENSNRATIDAADFIYAKHVLTPRLEAEREFMQERIVPEYDERLILDYISPIESDQEFALRVGTNQPHILTVDEWRETAGKPPLENGAGKIYVVAPGVKAVRSLEELIEEKPATGPTPMLNPDGTPVLGPDGKPMMQEPPPGAPGQPPGAPPPMGPDGKPLPPKPGFQPGNGAPQADSQPKPVPPQFAKNYEHMMRLLRMERVRARIPKDFDPSQDRDEGGRWTSGGGGGASAGGAKDTGGGRASGGAHRARDVDDPDVDDFAQNVSRGQPTPPSKGKAYDPDVDEDDDGDGVADFSRVGVPAHEVPPPPKDLPRLPNLTADERAAEDAFASMYERDPQAMVNAYNANIRGTSKDPRVFETDSAKWLVEDWKNNTASRGVTNLALHQTANAIVKRAFVEHLDTLKAGDTILVTAGGVGAGKGFALKNVPEALAMKDGAKAIWDSAGDQNSTELPWIKAEAAKRGLKMAAVYVHADPFSQWADPERGVVKRASDPKDGRMVDADVFADSYVKGASNFKAFADKNKDVSVVYLDNRAKPTKIGGLPKDATSIDRSKLYSHALKTIKERQKALPKPIIQGAVIGRRVWRQHHEAS